MENILNFNSFINENQKSDPQDWVQDGILLVRGLTIKGITRMYAFKIKKITNVGDGNGRMAHLDSQLYRIAKQDGNFKTVSIVFNQEYIKKNVGLKGPRVMLNAKNGKTPLWRDSVMETNFKKFLNDNAAILNSYKDIAY
jgi:hypothetical protein